MVIHGGLLGEVCYFVAEMLQKVILADVSIVVVDMNESVTLCS